MQLQPYLSFEPLAAQQAYQSRELAKLLVYLQERSPFYKKIFDKHHINIHNVKSVNDLRFLPTTSKNDIQQHNWEFLCVPDSEIREYAATSGALGKPVTIALTEKDLQRLAHNAHESFSIADGKQGNIYQLMLSLNRQIMAGMSCYMGLRQMGATVIRTGKMLPEAQWETILRLQPDTVISAPSYILTLAEWAKNHNIDLTHSPVQKAICLGESIRGSDFELNALGQKIQEHWQLKLYSIYAATEMQTAFTECSAGMGHHQQPEMVILEILNDRGDVLPAGEYGEVTITTLGVEGMPLLRYRTGDICAYYDSLCSCGRHTRRLSPILGRKQQMIKYKGVTLYPPAIFDILDHVDCISEYVVEVFTDEMSLDNIRLHVSTSLPQEACENKLEEILRPKLFSIPQLQFHTEASMQQLQLGDGFRKVKFIDRRDAA